MEPLNMLQIWAHSSTQTLYIFAFKMKDHTSDHKKRIPEMSLRGLIYVSYLCWSAIPQYAYAGRTESDTEAKQQHFSFSTCTVTRFILRTRLILFGLELFWSLQKGITCYEFEIGKWLGWGRSLWFPLLLIPTSLHTGKCKERGCIATGKGSSNNTPVL